MNFALNVTVTVQIPCYCGQSLGVHRQESTNSEFIVCCQNCGSEYKLKINQYGGVEVTGVKISEQAKDDKVVREACQALGIDPIKLRVKNGKGDVDLGRFAKVLVERMMAVNKEVGQYTSF